MPTIERSRRDADAEFDLKRVQITIRGAKIFRKCNQKPMKIEKEHSQITMETVYDTNNADRSKK